MVDNSARWRKTQFVIRAGWLVQRPREVISVVVTMAHEQNLICTHVREGRTIYFTLEGDVAVIEKYMRLVRATFK